MSGILSRHWGLVARFPSLATLALLGLCSGLGLGGCAIADLPVVGLPAGTPPRTAAQADYLAVHDLPPQRAETVMTPEQIDKAEKDLIAARNRQAFGAEKPARNKASDAGKAPQSQN